MQIRPNHRKTGKPSKALLIASLGAACCFVTPVAMAVNYVTNCADQGGSLREAVLEAPENGVVDATGLANVCSVITVKTGDIQVAVNDLTILGPGAEAPPSPCPLPPAGEGIGSALGFAAIDLAASV